MEIRNNELFMGKYCAGDLVQKYGSPLFVYEEKIVRDRCRELKNMIKKSNFVVNYSCKANGSIALLKIIREEGLHVDAMSPGEIFLELEAGFKPDEILYIGNNVSNDEMRYAIDKGIAISVDSLSQLESFGQIKRGGEVFVRINPGFGDGHHKSVITAGKVKFGIPTDRVVDIKNTATRYDVRIAGITMHIGSLFLKPDNYIAAIKKLLETAKRFPDIHTVDFGGGIGIPYNKKDARFPMVEFGRELEGILEAWKKETGRYETTFILEPGRYPVAECCTLLTTVHSIKENYGIRYIGTDAGFNVLIRPELYKAYHEIVVANAVESDAKEAVTVCGNICESGDLLAEGRLLPHIKIHDTLAVLDAGAYGFSMSSNYNARLRPAEILIAPDGNPRVIREREDFSYLLLNQKY